MVTVDAAATEEPGSVGGTAGVLGAEERCGDVCNVVRRVSGGRDVRQRTALYSIGTFVNIRLDISIYIVENLTENMNCTVFKVVF